MTNQPASTSHPKLHNSKTKITLMFEPIDADNITVWEYAKNKWSQIATLKKEFARTMWNYHVEHGSVRLTD